MRSKLLTIVALSAALAHLPEQGARAAETLARTLPERTILYAEVDIGAAADDLMDYLRFIDPQRAEGLRQNTLELIACLKEVAAQHEFTPSAIDGVAELKLYMVLMAKDEPEVKTHTYRSPKWDPEKGERIEGEFEERTYTTRKEFTASFVAEMPDDETAADLLEQLKALIERNDPRGAQAAWLEVEVDAGEMMGDPDDDQTLGRIGRYFVFSDGNPAELWAALAGGADPSLADSPVYGRLTREGERPCALVHVNLAALIEKLQESLLRDLEEAEEKYGPVPEGGAEGGFDQGAFRVRMARASLDIFLTFEKLLSLDRLGAAGVAIGIGAAEGQAPSAVRPALTGVGDGSAASRATALLQYREPVSPVLDLILDSGHALEAPEVGERDGVVLMARLGLKELFRAVKENLDPKLLQPLAMVEGMLKMQVGYDIAGILEAFAGDVCLCVDFVRKEIDQRRWDPETREVVTEKVMAPVPEGLFLIGIEDAEAFSRMLSDIVTRVTAAPGMGAVVGKRTFLATDIYVLGPGAVDEDAEPDGITSFAAAVVGRHLAIGSWREVTGLIRRAGAGSDGRLAEFVSRHPDANLLMFVPDSFNRKFRDLMKAEGEDPYDELRKGLAELDDLPVEDAELRERFRGAIERLVKGLLEVAEKGQAGSAGAEAWGERRDGFYEIRMKSEIRK